MCIQYKRNQAVFAVRHTFVTGFCAESTGSKRLRYTVEEDVGVGTYFLLYTGETILCMER
ncbi:MAG: hypothetical protein JWN14_1405 [Chthonomonadales bacterium]|nr:hypothetical protein [Chthonomonadales bacterium]